MELKERDTIGVSEFAAGRHVPTDRFTDFPDVTWEKVISRIRLTVGMVPEKHVRQGYRAGVVEVDVSPQGFRTPVVQLKDGQELAGVFEARREGEDPRKVIGTLSREKTPAKSVTVILYHRTVLEEGGEQTTGADWDIVSVNASPFEGREPIHPEILMHNHFGSDGGTATGMTPAEFESQMRESFLYWKDKASCL